MADKDGGCCCNRDDQHHNHDRHDTSVRGTGATTVTEAASCCGGPDTAEQMSRADDHAEQGSARPSAS